MRGAQGSITRIRGRNRSRLRPISPSKSSRSAAALGAAANLHLHLARDAASTPTALLIHLLPQLGGLLWVVPEQDGGENLTHRGGQQSSPAVPA